MHTGQAAGALLQRLKIVRDALIMHHAGALFLTTQEDTHCLRLSSQALSKVPVCRD